MDAGDAKLDAQWLQQIEEYRVETTVNVEPQLEELVRISPEITAFLEEQGEVSIVVFVLVQDSFELVGL